MPMSSRSKSNLSKPSASSPNCRGISFEVLETRTHMAAHIVGSSTSYSTIQAAVNAALAGQIVTVDAGTYNEQVTINKQLTIRGAQFGVDARTRSATESIVDGATQSTGQSMAFYVTANDVTIDGFTVQGETNQSVSFGAGIVIAPNVSGTHIINDIIQNNVSGVFLANSSATDPAIFEHNLFKSNNNAGTNGGRGIYTDGGISGGMLTNVLIDGNTFTNNHGTTGTTTAEAAIAFEATNPGQQTNLSVTNNTFLNNGKATLSFNVNNLLISGNTITGQTDSAGTLRFEGGDTNVTIINNTVNANGGTGIGVDAKGVPYHNSGFVVEHNNFLNNSADWGDRLSIVVQAIYYDGTFDATNNWWGSATGPSGQGTGTGDAVWGNGNWVSGHQWVESSGSEMLFSNWATSVFTFSTPTTPASISAMSSLSSGNTAQVTISWPASVGNVTTYELERSIDGKNFSVLTVLPVGTLSYVDSTVAANTVYYYRVAAEDGPQMSPYATTGPGQTVTVPSTNISTLNWVSATTGYGTIQHDKSINGNTLTLNGTTYSTGLGVHAASTIVYNLDGDYDTFTSDVGIDAEEDGSGTGSVDFQVIGDGKVLFDSGVLTNDQVAHISVSVSGVQQLSLVATNGVAGSIDYDHSDWAGAVLLGNLSAPATLPNLAGTVLTSTSVALTWAAGSANTASFNILRSTDGATFTAIATNVSGGATTYTDTTALQNTPYYYEIVAVNTTGTSAASNVVNVTTPSTASTTPVALSTLSWASATAGFGTVQLNKSISGNTLKLNGTTYTSGLGTHASSTIVYKLDGDYTTFKSDVGIDAEEDAAGNGYVEFEVIGDGKVLYDSGVLTNDQVGHINISVAGVQVLQLLAKNGIANSINYDHADWAGASLLGNPAAPAQPTGLAATVLSSTSVGLSWAAGSANTASYTLVRSSDGTNFITVASNINGEATSYTDNTAAPSMSYIYELIAVNSTGNSPNSSVAQASTPSTASTTPFALSSLNWASATAGFGTPQLNKSINGNALTLNGTTYASGIGTHASSTLTYNVDGLYSTFQSDVGIDGEEDGKGTGEVEFEVIGDGKVLFDSGVLTNDQVAHINISVAGVQTLELIAKNGIANVIDYDHADWAGATLLGTPVAPATPASVVASALSSSAIKLTWAAGSANTVSYTIARSTDGISFTNIATNVSGSATTYTDNGVLSSATKYYYTVTAVNSVGTAVSAIVNATTQQLMTVTYISDLAAVSSTTGYGTVQKDKSINGNTITLNGTTYAKGIGTHAASTIVYALGGNYTTFISDVGIDGEEDGKGQGYVDFQVWGDGKILYDSGTLTNDQIGHINVNVAGIQNLTLIATNGVTNDIDFDHADWAGAELLA